MACIDALLATEGMVYMGVNLVCLFYRLNKCISPCVSSTVITSVVLLS